MHHYSRWTGGRVLWSKSVAWLWDGVILVVLDFVINSFTRLSERQRTWWQIRLKTKAYRFKKVTILCSVWASHCTVMIKLRNKPCFALNCDIVRNGPSAFTTTCMFGLFAKPMRKFYCESDPETSLMTPCLVPLRQSPGWSHGNHQSSQLSGSCRNFLKQLWRSGRSYGNQA